MDKIIRPVGRDGVVPPLRLRVHFVAEQNGRKISLGASAPKYPQSTLRGLTSNSGAQNLSGWLQFNPGRLAPVANKTCKLLHF